MEDSSNNAECSQSTIQLKIKTLESEIHSFYVDRKISVSALKEKIEQELNIPVMQQRIIFRGRVLKDEHCLSEYQVDNGHTLHLVTRQSTQLQAQADGSSEDANGNNRSNEGSGAPSNNRIGQIAHSVLLGTINVGDLSLGDDVASDATRVIGAVLNSFGLSGLASGGLGAIQASNMTPHGNEVNGTNNAGGQGQSLNQSQSGHVTSSRSFQSTPQVLQLPLSAAAPMPSLSVPIPDSLSTLLDFMSRMEQTLAQNRHQQTNQHQERPRMQLPSSVQGVPNAEALGIVLNHAEQLLGGPVTAALSHVAGRLDNEGSSPDLVIRSEIQRESIHLGVLMQHLGALCLELGRTVLALRMGQQPEQSSVNSGPAVYISPVGPNPIMVQPFPWQTTPLFGGSVSTLNPVTPNAVGPGNVPRHVNIHIHAGTAAVAPVVSSIGTRANNVETLTSDHSNGMDSAGSGSTTVLPLRSFVATQVASNGSADGSQSVSSASTLQNTSEPLLMDMNLLTRAFVGSRQVGNQASADADAMAPSTTSAADINSYIRYLIANRQGGNQSFVDSRVSQPELAASVSQVPSDVASTPIPSVTSSNLRNLNANSRGNQSIIDSRAPRPELAAPTSQVPSGAASTTEINSSIRTLITNRQGGDQSITNDTISQSELGKSVSLGSSDVASRNLVGNREKESTSNGKVSQSELGTSVSKSSSAEVDSSRNVDNKVVVNDSVHGSDVCDSQNASDLIPLCPNVERNFSEIFEKEQTLGSVVPSCQGIMQEFSNSSNTYNNTLQNDNYLDEKDVSYFTRNEPFRGILNEFSRTQDGSKAAPLGLGFGNLERKNKSKAPKIIDGGSNENRKVNKSTSGLQMLRSVASSSGGIDSEGNQSDTKSSCFEKTRSSSMEEPSLNSEFGASNPMSEVLQSPAFDGLLTGISEQIGVGSPNMLRSILQQLSQNPQVMNTVGQIAQQVDTHSIEDMFSTLGDGQRGSIGFSRMMQQMMPIVPQVLSSVSASQQPLNSLAADRQNLSSERCLNSHQNLPKDEVDMQEMISRIECIDSPADIFEAVASAAVMTSDLAFSPGDFMPSLTNDGDLVDAYIKTLKEDIQGRRVGNS